MIKSVKGKEVMQDKALSMTSEELLELSHEDLSFALLSRCEQDSETSDTQSVLKAIGGVKRTYYTIYLFDMEIQNGGLCQFFSNSTYALAPYVSEELKKLGAVELAELYDGFCTRNNINPDDLSSFYSDSKDGYLAQTERYPFDEFDNAYNSTGDGELSDLLFDYAVQHIDEF
ncbi:MAG: DMP19 family protein [Clostridiales bacterium]|nr:DMP19 family protein [Clostridiales bacterium]